VKGEFKFEVQRCNLEGCEKVAGGRSEAKTTGSGRKCPHPDGVPDDKGMQDIFFEILTPFGVQLISELFWWFSLLASTTGYYLPALRADAH